MRVHYDVTTLATPFFSGIGVYVCELAKALIETKNCEIDFVYKASEKKSSAWIDHHLDFPSHPYWPGFSSFGLKAGDIFHGTDHRLLTSRSNIFKVITVHDLSAFEEGLVEPKLAAKLRREFTDELNRKDLGAVITVSEFTRQEMLKHFPFLEDKSYVIHLGIDHLLTHAPFTEKKLVPPVNEKPFILYVGSLERRKNVTTVIDAFDILKTSWPDLELVLVGRDGFGADAIHSRIDASPYSSSIIRIGEAEASVLVTFYREARVFLYPSLYEGFGLPILEAMYWGCPTITSNHGAMLEISGEGAWHAESSNAPQIAHLANIILSSPAEFEKRRITAQKNAQAFTWKLCAEKTLDVYRKGR
jgi:glycosyltransferase involved in cell wall biosynthesis